MNYYSGGNKLGVYPKVSEGTSPGVVIANFPIAPLQICPQIAPKICTEIPSGGSLKILPK